MAKVYLDKIDSIHLKKVQKMSLLLLFGKNKVDFRYIIAQYSYILMSRKYKSKFTEVIYNSLDEWNKNTILSVLLKAKSCILKIILQIYKVRRYYNKLFIYS